MSILLNKYRGVEQLVARLAHNQEVASKWFDSRLRNNKGYLSNISTKFNGIIRFGDYVINAFIYKGGK